MEQRNITRAFFGDGDSTVFTSVTDVIRATRADCAAVINIEAQFHDLHWVGAGEASVWTLPAISDFCTFTRSMYVDHFATLQVKGNGGSSVVDMSLLWLWWVAHHRHLSAGSSSPLSAGSTSSPLSAGSLSSSWSAEGWAAGRPYTHELSDTPTATDISEYRLKFDRAFEFAKKLKMPSVGSGAVAGTGAGVGTGAGAGASATSLSPPPASSPITPTLHLCNGMDSVGRFAFDHYHGWKSGTNFSLGLVQGHGVPSTLAASQYCGGRPETLDPVGVEGLRSTRLYLVNLHYQGNQKQVSGCDSGR